MGATSLSNTWFFVEGFTGPGFEEWICILNPWDDFDDLTFRFQTQEAGWIVNDQWVLGPHSRGSCLVNQFLGRSTSAP